MAKKSKDCACVTSNGRFVNVCEKHLDDEGRKWRRRAIDAWAEIGRLRAANVRLQEALAADPVDQSAEIVKLRALLVRWMDLSHGALMMSEMAERSILETETERALRGEDNGEDGDRAR